MDLQRFGKTFNKLESLATGKEYVNLTKEEVA